MDDRSVPDTVVALRVRVDGQFVVAGETTTDAQGRFLFDNIPADPDYVYLTGANWQTVHYPAQRIRLDHDQRQANVRITVHDAVQTPSPLVVRKHDIRIESKSEALRVTESLLVDNPSQTTYVGQPKKADGRAATMTLSIPADFVRTTFHEEFFGRRFTLIDGKLVTDIPSTPGTRELKFTYVLPNASGDRVWSRAMDLPTSDVHVSVKSETPDDIASNLKRSERDAAGNVTFTSELMSAGQIIQVEFGRQPISFAVTGRWLALVVLVGAIAGTMLVRAIRGRHSNETCRTQATATATVS